MKVGPLLVVVSLVFALVSTAAGCSRPGGTEDSTPVASSSAARASTSGTTTATATTPSSTTPRIVFLGDSLTAGLGLEPEQSIPSLIQARLEAEGYAYAVVNAGVSGDTSAGGLRRLDWSLEGPVALLVIELGANDGLRGLPVAEMKRNLAQIIAVAKQRGIRVMLTGMEAPPNYGAAYTSEFRQVFPDLAKEHRVAFVPFFLEGVAGDAALNQRDGIHPNPEGARVVERLLWKAIAPLLDKRDS